MNVEIVLMEYAQKSVLRQLLELYTYEWTEYADWDINEHGYFGYPYVDNYWNEPERYPYLIKADGKIAGFALICPHCEYRAEADAHCIGEFFVMLKYRRKGVGMQAAMKLFEKHKGNWEITYWKKNVRAAKFWLTVVDRYAPDNYQTCEYDDVNGKGIKHGGFLFSN